MTHPTTDVTAADDVAILVVCTGNVCRSPMAELVLADGLASETWLAFGSAGTQAREGVPMTPESAAIVREVCPEADTEAHRSRRISESLVNRSDLVLTMTRQQRTEVVGLSPRHLRRTFTLREFAVLFEALEASLTGRPLRGHSAAERWRELVEAVAGVRHLAPGDGDHDVTDPFGQGDSVYRISASQLLPAVATVQRAVRLAVGVVRTTSAGRTEGPTP